MRHPILRAACAALAAALLAACSDHAATAPDAALAPGKAARDAMPPLWANVVEGSIADGSKYALYRPTQWNGDVVYFAHGIIDPALPVALPTGDDAAAIRDGLGGQGFAVAYSSWSENGYDFKDGLQRTHQLRGLVAANFGQPRRSYLLGQSLGAQIVQALAEQYPTQYDGALAMCGVLGGTKLEVDYIGNVRTLFDHFYPGWLPGTTTMSMPVIPDQNTVVNAALAAMAQDNFRGFGAMMLIDQGALAGRTQTEVLTTLLNVLVYHARGVDDFLDRTHLHSLFDNSQTVYTSAALPPAFMDALNATVDRYAATPDAAAWLEHDYEPSGQLHIPMLTVHKRFDRLVPYAHEAAYQKIVDAAGSSAMLRQRTMEDYGHCEFGADATVARFQELVAWVTAPPAA
ncbi:MAG TPA: alpha/beta hydrolase-fold protein [Gemmatimonadaceae bacterium]|nr:alpha/beta hydrolase-fold protein [Gemmatimonadaceae bacterium]